MINYNWLMRSDNIIMEKYNSFQTKTEDDFLDDDKNKTTVDEDDELAMLE